jgi:class 3 adenylate cyclase
MGGFYYMGKIYPSPNIETKFNKEQIQQKNTGELKKITVMFVDLRGFSHILEKRDPQRVLKILDIYFRVIVSIVNKNNGIVDKYIGDGLMAIWGLPKGKKSDAYNTIRAAIEMRIGMFRLIPELVKIGEVPLEIGIGIGTGVVVTGFVGPSSKRDCTMVGKCINRTARLQSIAFDNRIFVDNSTASEIKPYSYLIRVPKISHSHIFKDENIYELEGIYQFDREYESVRRHPRVTVAKVVGITKSSSNQRKVALIKSISEGGIGIEIHHYEDFELQIGEKIIFDSRGLSLLGKESVSGVVVRKKELKESGIFRIKTWDIGVKILKIHEETKKKLLIILMGRQMVKNFGET